MASLRVSPTRMELTRLKARMKVAARGHKLLKDKRDGMVKKYIELIRKNKEIRERVEEELTRALGEFLMASAVMSPEVLEESVIFPTRRLNIKAKKQNIMGVNVPLIEYEEQIEEGVSPYPYGFAGTSAELDGAIALLAGILPKLIELAQIEKTCLRLADEIEKTRRTVNALEYIIIPQLNDTIRYITMKLDENDRGNRTRLMKVKEMLEKRA